VITGVAVTERFAVLSGEAVNIGVSEAVGDIVGVALGESVGEAARGAPFSTIRV